MNDIKTCQGLLRATVPGCLQLPGPAFTEKVCYCRKKQERTGSALERRKTVVGSAGIACFVAYCPWELQPPLEKITNRKTRLSLSSVDRFQAPR
jgi:hypothetical protein